MPSREPSEREAKRLNRRRRAGSQATPTETIPSAEPAEAILPPRRSDAAWRFDLHRDITRWALRLPQRELAVLLALWDRQPKDRRPFPVSHATLGADCGLARRHAAAAAKSLERRGLVAVVSRGNSRTREANRYRLPERLPEPPG
jgi:hypothetical protein